MRISTSELHLPTRIKFVNNSTFFQFLKNNRHDAIEVAMKNVKAGKKCYTSGLSTCLGGGFENSEDVCIFHSGQEVEEVGKKLISNAKKLKSQDKKLQGLLIGGELTSLCEYSLKYFRDLFAELGIKSSIFGGQGKYRETRSSVFHSVNDNTWFVNVDSWADFKNNAERQMTTANDLREVYDVIDISHGHEVYAGDNRLSF